MIEINGLTVLSRLIRALEPSVPRIHVVVGYREELIIEHCARYHRRVVIVRNPDFRSTNTAFSMALGAQGIPRKVLYLDGDLLIAPSSLRGFLKRAAEVPVLLGTTRAKSEQAVFVSVGDDESGAGPHVTSFSRSRKSEWEWASVFVASPDLLEGANGFVFERISDLLPLPAQDLVLCEIDTPRDLEEAEAFVRNDFAY